MNDMIIDAYTFCYNEEIRLKYYLNLYAPLCRTITIHDNGSTDSSKKIAEKYDNVIWNTQAYSQNEINDDILRNVKNNCWKQNRDADWVIVCDVDEILYHKNGLHTYLRYILNETDKRIIQATGYDMVSTKLPTHTGNFYDDENFQYGVENGLFNKTCIFAPSSIDEIRYLHGSHRCKPTVSGPDSKKRIQKMSLFDGELKLLHYKYLNKESFICKQKISGERMAEINKEKGWGLQYLWEHERLEQLFDEKLDLRKKIL